MVEIDLGYVGYVVELWYKHWSICGCTYHLAFQHLKGLIMHL